MFFNYSSYYPTIIKMMKNIHMPKYEYNEFSYLQDKQLLEYFEDTSKFLSLKKEPLKNLFKEVAHRLSVRANMPDFVVKVNLVKNGDKYRENELNNCFSYGHVTSVSPHIEVNVLKAPDARFVPPSLINKLGLIYLETIVHEHRHMQQAYYRARMLDGYKVSPDMQLMGMNFVLTACDNLLEAYQRDYLDYCVEFQEIDARLYSFDVFSKWNEHGSFKNAKSIKSYVDNKVNREFGAFIGDRAKVVVKKFQRNKLELNRRVFDLFYGYDKKLGIRKLLDEWEDKYTISIQKQMFDRIERYYNAISSKITKDMKSVIQVTKTGVEMKEQSNNNQKAKQKENDYEY